MTDVLRVQARRDAPEARKRPVTSLHTRRARLALVYSSPLAILVAVLFVVPLLLMVWMSFNDWPLLGASKPNGVENYGALTDPLLKSALWFTVKYTAVTTVVLSVVAFGLALLVQEARPGVGFFRTVYFLPSAVGFASASLLFVAAFNNDIGPFPAILSTVGLGDGRVDWLGPGNAMYSVIGVVLWRFAGFNMLLLMVGLQAIDPSLYEAARTDGASRWKLMRYVTLPLLRPSLALMLVLSVTGSLLAFDQFFILTGGRNGTATIVIAIYRQAFIQQNLGRAAALSVIVLLALVLINTGQLVALRRGNR